MSRKRCLAADLPENLLPLLLPEPWGSRSDTHTHLGLDVPQSLTFCVLPSLALLGSCGSWLTDTGPEAEAVEGSSSALLQVPFSLLSDLQRCGSSNNRPHTMARSNSAMAARPASMTPIPRTCAPRHPCPPITG